MAAFPSGCLVDCLPTECVGDPSGATLLLDKGTHLPHWAAQRPSVAGFGQASLTVWPTCGEASIFLAGGPARGGLSEGEADGEANRDRAGRRARSEVRRYVRHNELPEVLTYTYRDDRLPGLDRVPKDVEHFWRRWCRATGEKIPPYVLVPEWGSKRGRLHLHMACEWFRRLGAVEVCERCATANLRVVRADLAAPGVLCVGCLWGHGFVGRPEEHVADPDSASAYCAKYLGKDLAVGGPALFGRRRFRTALGYKPEAERFEGLSLDAAYQRMLLAMGGEEYSSTWSSTTESDSKVPVAVWTFYWKAEGRVSYEV